MIEIIGEIRDTAPKKPEITPEEAVSACNTIRQYCENQCGCITCRIRETCSGYFMRSPNTWPEIE